MNAICLESVLQRESSTGSANGRILPRVAIKAYVRVCLALACLVCVRMQMWMHLNPSHHMSVDQMGQARGIPLLMHSMDGMCRASQKLKKFFGLRRSVLRMPRRLGLPLPQMYSQLKRVSNFYVTIGFYFAHRVITNTF